MDTAVKASISRLVVPGNFVIAVTLSDASSAILTATLVNISGLQSGWIGCFLAAMVQARRPLPITSIPRIAAEDRRQRLVGCRRALGFGFVAHIHDTGLA